MRTDQISVLPKWWRLADHRKYGRVFVTHTTPDKYGHLYIVLPSIGKTKGRAWQFCTPDEITYLDGNNQELEEE